MVVEKGVNNAEKIKVIEPLAVESGKAPIEHFQAKTEQLVERADNSTEEGVSNTETKSSGLTSRVPNQSSLADVRQEKEIENILAEGLTDVFLSLKPDEQQKFKTEGEETAKSINKLLSESKIQIAKIFNLIKNWLTLLPGVNKYFIEQEAKIKVDEIIQLKKGGEQ